MKSEITQGMKIGAVALISLTSAFGQTGYPSQDNQYPAPYPARQPSYQQQPPAYQQEPGYQDQGAQQPQGRYFTAQELDGLVGRIALHPDSMLAQILTAATYPDQIDALSRGGNNGNLDPAVEGLRQYPQVLEMMTSDMNWTADLGWA